MKKFLKKLFLSMYISFFIVLGFIYFFENEPFVLRFLYTGILTASGILIYIIVETTLFKQKS